MATAPEFRQVQLVGRKIRQLRKERRLTQTELAVRLGIGEFFEEVARESITPRDLRLVRVFHELDSSTQQEVESLILDRVPPARALDRRSRLERSVS